MKTNVLFGISLVLCLKLSSSLFLHQSSFNRTLKNRSGSYRPGNPLILTPLINEGKVEEARAAAEVKFADFKNVKSYAAYLTVDQQYDSNLFFWFFPSTVSYENAPVVLWLQGGPGISSMLGLFVENGPFQVTENEKLELRQYPWTIHHSVIYIDNPVGTGFSFTNGGFAENQTIVGEQLYAALLQFFQIFPELQKNPFYVTGESYGGKYVPAAAYAIHKNNPFNKDQHINLQGIAIGNGWCDPETQLLYAAYVYQLGLVDWNAKAHLESLQNDVVKLISNRKWLEASQNFNQILMSYYFREVGPHNFYNYLQSNEAFNKPIELLTHYLQRKDVRAAIHVDNATFDRLSSTVYCHMSTDLMQSVAPWISELLDHYRVLFYNGQLDISVAYPLTVNFLRQLDFSAANEYKTAPRHKWLVNSEIAGYVKKAGNLTEVLVRNAGHLVPTDQPLWALDLITRFTRNLMVPH